MQNGDQRKTLDRMKAGFQSFRALYYAQRPERITSLMKEGQKPEVLVIACSDSRVDPAILMNSEPGEMFVIRNVAALVPPYAPQGHDHGTSAALEYAVCDLKVQDVVVLAHSGCGGVGALVSANRSEPQPERDFIQPWMSVMGDDIRANPAQASQETLRRSLRNLSTFPFVRAACDGGSLALHGWWFNMTEGALYGLNEKRDLFERMA